MSARHRRGTAPGLQDVSLSLRAGQITGLAGVSGNGQAALADFCRGLVAPGAGRLEIARRRRPAQLVARALRSPPAIGRIPEDRHRTGTIADFTLTENAVLETYCRPRQPPRLDGLARRAETGGGDHHAYDVRCPGPQTRIRLLSGGNMQKMILGRVLEERPRVILANQPVRGLDIGAVTYVQDQLLAARDAGAAVLLISEDLDEILALSDVIHVISEGRLSPPSRAARRSLRIWASGWPGRASTHAA